MTKPLLVAWDFFGVINAVDPDELRPILQQVMDLRAEQIIVSHSSRTEIEHYLELHQLNQFFVTVYGAEWHMTDSGMGKAPALLNYIESHGPFGKLFMIGDSMNDMADARQAKMMAVLFDIDQHYSNVADEADIVVTDLGELMVKITG